MGAMVVVRSVAFLAAGIDVLVRVRTRPPMLVVRMCSAEFAMRRAAAATIFSMMLAIH
jgi:hypothetical protein